jgi:CheY-like chemotaxis protein
VQRLSTVKGADQQNLMEYIDEIYQRNISHQKYSHQSAASSPEPHLIYTQRFTWFAAPFSPLQRNAMNKHILIIDDEPDIREATQMCLEIARGWKVTTAGSSREGLEKAMLEQPDAVLLDVMMPDTDGLTTFEQLRANPVTQHIPVILLTAKAQPDDRRCFAKLNVAAVITKPYDPLTLADQIADVLG